MSFNFKQFCDDFGVAITTEGKHSRYGWFQINCPFCDHGQNSFHMGYNISRGNVSCWKCGSHSLFETVGYLANADRKQLSHIFKKYQGEKNYVPFIEKQYDWNKKFSLPQGSVPELTPLYHRYLESRDFNSNEILRKWRVQSAPLYGNYGYRLIIPVYLNRKMVCYTARDITDHSKLRYKNCDNKEAILPIKECIYGIDHARDKIVIVEGPTDVWRLGYGAVATFGTAYTTSQIKLLKNFKTRYIMFDPSDKNAMKQADKMASELSAFSGRTEIIKFKGYEDPGDLPQKEADSLMRELGL